MAVITLAGQVGTGEKKLGIRVAKALNYKIVSRQVFEQVLKEYGIVRFEEILDSPPNFLDRYYGERHDAVDLLNKMYLIFAKMNNVVIVSRRAYIILRPFINVLNVFLKAPSAFRIRNFAEQHRLESKKAEDEVKSREKVRRKFIQSFYNQRWDSFHFISLVINVHKIGFDLAEKFIIEASKKLCTYDNQVGWQDGFPTIETIEIDTILEEAVNKVLSEEKIKISNNETDDARKTEITD
jgi:cytidylate kinase